LLGKNYVVQPTKDISLPLNTKGLYLSQDLLIHRQTEGIANNNMSKHGFSTNSRSKDIKQYKQGSYEIRHGT
jgi:hypothetical protein